MGVYHLVIRLEVIGKKRGSGWELSGFQERSKGPHWTEELISKRGQLDPMVCFVML